MRIPPGPGRAGRPARPRAYSRAIGRSTLTVEAVPGKRNPWWKAIAVTAYAFFTAVDDSRPSLVARNERGEECLLFRARNWEEAVACRDRLRTELAAWGEQAWIARYHVPATFL